MLIKRELTQKFNEAALVIKFLSRMHKKHLPSDNLNIDDFDAYLHERTKAQYKDLNVPSSNYLASATLELKPDYTPSSNEEAEEFIKAMMWEIHATNNALSYDFNRFGESPFQAAVANDPDREAVVEFAKKENLQNILRLVK